MRQVIINFVVFQFGWFASVLSAAGGLPAIGIAVVATAVVLHLAWADRPLPELALIGLAGLTGLVLDSLLVSLGWLSYPSGNFAAGLAPYWIIAMWLLFATTLNVSLRWLRPRIALAAVLGAVAGPLAYYGGQKLGAVRFDNLPLGLLGLAVGWGIAMPLLAALARRFDGFRTARAAAAPSR